MTPSRARLAAALLACALIAAGGTARSALVTNTNDSGDGSLRQAIIDTNGDVIDNEITFDFDPPVEDPTIQLETPLPEVMDTLTINGVGAGVTVSGDGTSIVTTSARLDIRGVTLMNGSILDGNVEMDPMNQESIFTDVIISGTGTLEKGGAPGTSLRLTTSSNELPAVVSQGTLVSTNEGTDTPLFGLKNDVQVDSGAFLEFRQERGDPAVPIDGPYSGALRGTGTLSKTGEGKLTLTGNNKDFQGTAKVMTGTLELQGASSPAGDIDVAANARLVFNQTGASDTYGGKLMGTGSVEKTGPGSLTLTGASSMFEGTFEFKRGTLIADASSMPREIQNTGDVSRDAVVFSQNVADTYSGQICGGPLQNGTCPAALRTGSVNTSGSENLSLSGVIGAGIFSVLEGSFSMTTGGTLLVGDGSVDPNDAFRLRPGATLAGNSTAARFGGQQATLNGIISPGGATVGTLATSFDTASFLSESSYHVNVNDADDTDFFEAKSILADSGAKILLTPSTLSHNVIDRAIMRAESDITRPNGDLCAPDCFVLENGDLFFFFEEVQTVDNEVLLTLFGVPVAFEDEARTPNQAAVGKVIDEARDQGRLAGFFDSISGIQTQEVPALLDALSGESYSSFATPRLAAKRRLDRGIETRVRGFAAQLPGSVPEKGGSSLSGFSRPGLGRITSSAGLLSLAAGPDGALFAFAPAPQEAGLGAWIDGYGVFGSVDGSAGAADNDYGVYGATLGLDYRFSPHFMLGGGAGYARVESELGGRTEEGWGDVGQFTFYGTGVWDRVHVAGWTRLAFGGYQVERRIRADQLDVKAKGDFDAWEYSFHGELGVRAVDAGRFQIRPLGSIDYARLEQDSVSETGAVVNGDSLNLLVPSQSWNSLVSGLGASAQGVWEMEEGLWFVPELHARWVHEFGDIDRRVVPTLTGAGLPYTPFIGGAEAGRDGVIAGVGWGVSARTGLNAYVDYELGWVPNLLQHTIKGGFQFVF